MQLASAAAVQAHSGCVETVSEPAPPLSAIESSAAIRATEHFGASGLVTDSEDDGPQAEPIRTAATNDPKERIRKATASACTGDHGIRPMVARRVGREM